MAELQRHTVLAREVCAHDTEQLVHQRWMAQLFEPHAQAQAHLQPGIGELLLDLDRLLGHVQQQRVAQPGPLHRRTELRHGQRPVPRVPPAQLCIDAADTPIGNRAARQEADVELAIGDPRLHFCTPDAAPSTVSP